MSHSVYFDSRLSDDERRAALYEGQLFVFSSLPSVQRMARFARQMIEDAFAPLDPETAHHELAVERFAEILGELKPRFIHHPESKQHLRDILQELGCDLEQTYFDVPRLRSSTSDDYLTTGIAYAWHPHRDTWYSAPHCQQNFWMPVYEIEPSNAMAFHPGYWNRPVANSSRHYNYYDWNRQHRGPHVATLVKADPRPLPRAEVPITLDPQIRLLAPVGGIIVFSGAHMHSSVPNSSGRTRYSIDFRTVHLRDAIGGVGAPRSDEECTGTTMRDYLRCSDLTALPEEVVARYDDGTAGAGLAVYRHVTTDSAGHDR
jgi:hypothetical protein